MNHLLNVRRMNLRNVLTALAISMFVAGGAVAAKPLPPVDDNELLGLGFKVLVAQTPAQSDWVKRLAPGQIRAMQRTGKKYFIYPDAAKNQVYVGSPREYEAYKQLHPDSKLAGEGATKQASDYRAKQDTAMKKSSARDLSDPYYWMNTATWTPVWTDLGW